MYIHEPQTSVAAGAGESKLPGGGGEHGKRPVQDGAWEIFIR